MNAYLNNEGQDCKTGHVKRRTQEGGKRKGRGLRRVDVVSLFPTRV